MKIYTPISEAGYNNFKCKHWRLLSKIYNVHSQAALQICTIQVFSTFLQWTKPYHNFILTIHLKKKKKLFPSLIEPLKRLPLGNNQQSSHLHLPHHLLRKYFHPFPAVFHNL